MEYELMRLKLSSVSTLEKAELIAALRKKWELGQGRQVRRGGDQKSKAASGGFYKMVCEATGLPKRTVQNFWKIGSSIRVDLAAALTGSPLAYQTTKLLTISSWSSSQQQELLLSIQTGADVAKLVGSTEFPLDRSEKEYDRFINTWRNLRPETRMRFLSTLASAA